jgi:cell division protein FtsI (penicillin-binding protein 3)
VLTTTLQLGLACSVVANGGLLNRPRLILEPGKPVTDPQADAVRVLKPETAAIMRSMMQGVVLNGTGRAAQLRGYSSAGKTGSAQIYDHATRTYSHKYNASFMGFSPVNRPAIVVVVTLNGASKFGGAVAAPVFTKVASAALRFLDVPKDLPDRDLPPVVEEPESDLAIADLGGTNQPPDEEDQGKGSQVEKAGVAVAAEKRVFGPQLPPPPPVVPVAVVPAGPKAPDFRGKTLRDVLEESTALGIQVEFKGNGIARLQQPSAGSVLHAGEHIRVIFAR